MGNYVLKHSYDGLSMYFIIRMSDERLQKKVFYGELQEGKRSQGGQKKRYNDTMIAFLKDFDIPIKNRLQTAQEGSKWRGLMNNGAVHYEEKRICEAEIAVLGTDCTRAIKVARSDKQRSSRDSVKLKETTESAKPQWATGRIHDIDLL